MTWLASRLAAAIIVDCAAISLTGCSEDAPPKKIELPSLGDRTANASRIVAFVQQQCVDRADDIGKFRTALRATGWLAAQTQTGDDSNPLALRVWELPHATLILGQPVLGGMWTCALTTSPDIAPTPQQFRAALEVVGREPDAGGEWWWNPRLGVRVHLTANQLSGAGAHGLMISTEVYHLPWWRTILG